MNDRNPSLQIREIDPDSSSDVAAVSGLHLELLHWGPIAQLGELFLRRFIYSRLVKDGLLKAVVCRVDNKPAGFIAYTADSIGFQKKVLKKHFFYALYIMSLTLMRHPKLMARLPRIFRMTRARRLEDVDQRGDTAEILAIGICPQFSLVRRGRESVHVSHELFYYAVSNLKNKKMRYLRLFVDGDNMPALLFYQGLGGSFKKSGFSAVDTFQIRFDLDKLNCQEILS